ncbi:MAG TPA: hypothetical protein VGR25_02625 [bacterium]|jgi:hypothetical protein|nr:hypothetical protein [bacterium]
MKALLSGIALILLFAGGVAYAQYSTPAPPPPAPAPASPAPASPSPRAQAPANVKAEVTTAATHAGFAAKGGNFPYVRLHLGHALNCLEGPKGKNFNKSWGNVCEGQGNGILTDLKSAPTLIALARKADGIALKGTKTTSLVEAKSAAQQVAGLLSQIAKQLK